MSDNKNKTFLVQRTFVVKARNQGLAIKAAMAPSRRVEDTKILGDDTTVERIPAVNAESYLS